MSNRTLQSQSLDQVTADNTEQIRKLQLKPSPRNVVQPITTIVQNIVPEPSARSRNLSVPGALFPDATGTGNQPATLERFNSAAAQTANTPKVSLFWALFDQTVEEHLFWQFRVPDDYVSGGVVVLEWAAKATTGDVVWKGGIAALVALSTDLDAAAVYVAADLGAPTTAPGTQGQYTITDIPLTMTGVVAGALTQVFVGRDTSNAADTLAADACLLTVDFTYSAA